MPQIEMPLDFGYSKSPKEYAKNREAAIKTLMDFFPRLWSPEFANQFYGVIVLALQEANEGNRVGTDVYLTLKRATDQGELAYGHRYDQYSQVLLNTKYDMLPVLANEQGVIDGNHRMNSYYSLGLAPPVIQITSQPQQEGEPRLIAQFDDSVRERKIINPQRYEQVMREEMDERGNNQTKSASKQDEKLPLSVVKKLPYQSLNRMIKKMREYLKKNEVVQKVFKEYGVDIEEIDYIPMMFGKLDVSAKTDHGVIIYNYKLLTDGDFFKDFSYGVHEMTHWLQQTTGSKATRSSDDGSYLDNPYEQEGFQNQVEYIADQFGDGEAEKYVDDLLEHHEVEDKKEKEDKKEILMSKAQLGDKERVHLIKKLLSKYHPDHPETGDPGKFHALLMELQKLQGTLPPPPNYPVLEVVEPESPTINIPKEIPWGDWFNKYVKNQ